MFELNASQSLEVTQKFVGKKISKISFTKTFYGIKCKVAKNG